MDFSGKSWNFLVALAFNPGCLLEETADQLGETTLEKPWGTRLSQRFEWDLFQEPPANGLPGLLNKNLLKQPFSVH